jgi:hypothetical protein
VPLKKKTNLKAVFFSKAMIKFLLSLATGESSSFSHDMSDTREKSPKWLEIAWSTNRKQPKVQVWVEFLEVF